jgi:hypothetical protein
VKQSQCEVHHSSPSSAEIKTEWSYTSAPPKCHHGMVDRENCTFFTLEWNMRTFSPTMTFVHIAPEMKSCSYSPWNEKRFHLSQKQDDDSVYSSEKLVFVPQTFLYRLHDVCVALRRGRVQIPLAGTFSNE